jgi:hypothetical protein
MIACTHCGQILSTGQTVCPRCHTLVNSAGSAPSGPSGPVNAGNAGDAGDGPAQAAGRAPRGYAAQRAPGFRFRVVPRQGSGMLGWLRLIAVVVVGLALVGLMFTGFMVVIGVISAVVLTVALLAWLFSLPRALLGGLSRGPGGSNGRGGNGLRKA